MSACSSRSTCRSTRPSIAQGVHEAHERTIADAKLFEAQQDEARSEIYDLLVQASVRRNVVHLLRDTILPRTREALELAKTDYARSNVDIATLLSAMREVLQIQVQIAQVEAELGKALALLERTVGCEIKDKPLVGAAHPRCRPSTLSEERQRDLLRHGHRHPP